MDYDGAELSYRVTAVDASVMSVGCGHVPSPHFVRLSAIAGALLALVGCSAEQPMSSSVEPFPESATSLEDLGERALSGVVAGEAEALESLRVTEDEHNGILWPELPSSDPALNVDLGYLWLDMESRNRAAVSRAIGWFEEREAEYHATTCRGQTQVFDSFQVHTDCWVSFRSPGLGSNEEPALYEVQLFKDAIERGGGFKIFRYYDEAPMSVGQEPGDA